MDFWYDKYKAAQSDGTLPNANSARAFRYKKAIIYEVDLSAGGISGGIQEGKWTVTFVSEDESTVFFRHKVHLKLFIAALGLSPGLFSFTWNYVKDEFETSVVGGVETTEANIGQFLIGGTAASEQGDMDPAQGLESTNQTARIIADWISPIYVFADAGQTLPPGYKVKVTADTWGFGPTSVEYGWAFEDGAALLSLLHDNVGAVRMAVPNKGTELSYLYPAFSPYSSPTRRRILSGVNGGHIVKTSDNALWLLGVEGTVGKLWLSEDDGTTLNRATRKLAIGTEEEIVMFGTGFTMLDLKVGRDDRLWALALKSQILYLASSADSFHSIITVGKARSNGGYGLAPLEDGTVLVMAPDHRYLIDAGNITEAGQLAAPVE